MTIHNIQVRLRPVQCTFYIFHPSSREETVQGYAISTPFFNLVFFTYIRQFSLVASRLHVGSSVGLCQYVLVPRSRLEDRS